MRLWRDLATVPPARDAAWTTIMTWNPFKGPLVHEGREYGAKGPEFEKLIDLPRESGRRLEVAVGGLTDVLKQRLTRHGWQVADGPATTRTPRLYRQFLAESRGELSCAKEVYVALRTGWFSERTVCYLASGRPAVVQDTGFAADVPLGEGLLAFDDAAGARAGIERVERDYDDHCRAARRVAEARFAAQRVLGRLLERIAAASV
jgi:hypothetical protein